MNQRVEVNGADPRHPSLHFKKTGEYGSVRIGEENRALGRMRGGPLVWFWIGPHDADLGLIRQT